MVNIKERLYRKVLANDRVIIGQGVGKEEWKKEK